jgi:TolB protein
MMLSNKKLFFIIGIALLLGCLFGLGVFLSAIWMSRTIQPVPPPLIFPTRGPLIASPSPDPGVEVPTLPSVPGGPQGKIVYVCQIFRLQARDQLCLINADGTGQQRLTTEDTARHFYPSFAPDGQSVLFSSNLDGNFKSYEMSLTGLLNKIGDTVGIAPEVSPDNQSIAFVTGSGGKDYIWVMDRDGSHPRVVYSDGWDPTWSPDGSRILFATTIKGKPQLASTNVDGSDFRQITDLPDLRGRSDWSADGVYIITYSGKTWLRELFIMNADGSGLHQITPPGGNSQGPSFSPDGKWVVFTAYFNSIGNNNGCEIYIMRIDGTSLTRLTNNNYCDWQPRWGQ